MPEVADQYMGAETAVPRGVQIVCGHVVAKSHDANENVMGRAL